MTITTHMPHAPVDDTITIPQMVRDPYSVYARLRRETPVLHVKALGRTLLTRAEHTKWVKDSPDLFSTNDPDTPMQRAFRAHTLMRKDGEEHARERGAMAPAFSGRTITQCWTPIYTRIAEEYVAALPRGETVDMFTDLTGPYAAACLSHLLGIPEVDADTMQRWSQILIDGAGNFGWDPALFAECDKANDEMDAVFLAAAERHRAVPDQSALSVMVNAEDPIPQSQIHSNIKIAIGGGINEPRDAALTIIYGLLSNPDQFDDCKRDGLWTQAFEEGVRWVAPIQVSSRVAKEDVEIGGFLIPKGDTVMTSQASANHDEAVFEDGHLFDIHRAKTPHQAFGNGPHFCQGTHIARRMLANILLPMLFDRFPNMELADAGKVAFTGFGFRGPRSLPVVLN